MDDPIEIVARAVEQHIHAEIESDVRASELTEEELQGIARAALLALREPTEGMVEAGGNCLVVNDDGNDPSDVWQAMIDAALGSQTQEKGNA